jgi:hypothetical protein
MNRLHTYRITNKAKTKELNIIQDTLCSNEYNINLRTRHSKNHKHNKNTSSQHQTTKWVIFTSQLCHKRRIKVRAFFWYTTQLEF